MPRNRKAKVPRPRLPRARSRDTHLFTAGPRRLRAALLQSATPAPTIPAWLQRMYPIISLPEALIYVAHLTLGLGREGTGSWRYQKGVNGGRVPGGAVVDFIEYDVRVMLNISGEYWHYKRGTAWQVRDLLLRAQTEKLGYELVIIDESDALRDARFYLQQARRGIDLSKASRGARRS